MLGTFLHVIQAHTRPRRRDPPDDHGWRRGQGQCASPQFTMRVLTKETSSPVQYHCDKGKDLYGCTATSLDISPPPLFAPHPLLKNTALVACDPWFIPSRA